MLKYITPIKPVPEVCTNE